MKLNRGLTWETFEKRHTNWHPYFAWWPCLVGDNDTRWLETIERKATWAPTYTHCWLYEYRALEEK